MSIVTIQDLAMSFGPLDVFEGIRCAVEQGDRIGLVGLNGEGKTTLLRLIAGDLIPTAGAIHLRKGLRYGYLPQDPPPVGGKTLWQDMLDVFAALQAEERALQDLEAEMGDPDRGDAALALYAERQQRFELRGGYEYPLQIQQTLTGLGFSIDEFEVPLKRLSGGQRTRALLARLLLEKPDLLLMDEPTNHLDLQAVEWLENTLLGWKGAMVIVAHDRYFLDQVANRIWEMAWGELNLYRGNYSHFVLQRRAHLERLQKEYEAQQEKIAKEEDYIRRNIAGQNTRQAQGRRTRLERMLRQKRIIAPRSRRKMALAMETRLRSGTLVLATDGLSIGYQVKPSPIHRVERSGGYVYVSSGVVEQGDFKLFSADDLALSRGERVGLIGANGTGKTTFVKTLLGQIPPLTGELRVGASIRIGYLAQVQSAFDSTLSALDNLLTADPKMTPAEARHLLARFLFSGDDVFKEVTALSGGQRSRLALAILTRSQANFLVLDEPTNHLDIESQEVLEAMLNEFNGTVLLVSHDRFLIDAIATHVWAIDDGRLRVYRGNYSAYVSARQDEKLKENGEQKSQSEAQQHRARAREDRRERQEVKRRQEEAQAVESRIHATEAEMANVSDQLVRAGRAQRLDDVQQLSQRYADLEQELDLLLESWASLV